MVHASLMIHSFLLLKKGYDRLGTYYVLRSTNNHFIFKVDGFSYIECDVSLTFVICPWLQSMGHFE